jgi:hypothetical protein
MYPSDGTPLGLHCFAMRASLRDARPVQRNAEPVLASRRDARNALGRGAVQRNALGRGPLPL